jgi:hypothetical protein
MDCDAPSIQVARDELQAQERSSTAGNSYLPAAPRMKIDAERDSRKRYTILQAITASSSKV